MARIKETRPAIEEADRYVIPIAGRPVSRCYLDSGFGILFYSGGPKTEIRIESRIRFVKAGSQSVSDLQEPASLVPLLGLFGRVVTGAYAFKNGSLRVDFEDGSRIEVDPGERFEPWEVSAEDGLKIVSTPGGDIAFWQSFARD